MGPGAPLARSLGLALLLLLPVASFLHSLAVRRRGALHRSPRLATEPAARWPAAGLESATVASHSSVADATAAGVAPTLVIIGSAPVSAAVARTFIANGFTEFFLF